MAAGRYSFVIEQGATLDFEIAYTDSNGDPIDLTDHSGSNSSNPPTSGTIGIFISAYSSSLLDFKEAVYELEIVSGSTYPVVTRVLEGKIKLSKEVTTGNY